MSALTTEQRIQKAHVSIMSHKSTMAYSSILMVGESTVRDDVPTAATNGRDVMYGRAFVDGLSDPELVGLVLHERLHMVYQHAWLWKHLWKENPQLANMAADYVINCEIKELEKKYSGFIKLPACGLYDHTYEHMDTGEVYRLLKKQQEEGGGGQGQPLDEHNFDELNEEEQEEAKKEIEQAVRQGAMMAGKLGGDQSRAIEELTQPKVDWREQLREFMSSVAQGHDDSTWRRPNRRWLGEDLYMPSSIAESMGPLVVGIDTSGSIGQKELASFLSEIVGICENTCPEVLHLIECDARIQSHEVYDQAQLGQIAAKRSMRGGGGTDMREVHKYVEKNNLKPEAIVVLTDGWTPYPETINYPTLWAMTDKRQTAPIGSTVWMQP